MGLIFALIAALCNSSIGIFSKYIFIEDTNINHISIAFFRCFFAFIFISIILLFKKNGFNDVKRNKENINKFLIISFFGVFILYFFEIWALSITSVSVVSFLLYASGILTIILGIVWLKEVITPAKIISMFLIMLGIVMIFSTLFGSTFSIKGGILAIIAGSGYSLFLILLKRFEISGTLATLWWLFAFGSMYLFIPFLYQGCILPKIDVYPYLMSLALIPTICGYYFTSKSVSLIEAGRVQLIEMSEPFFASILALIVLHEKITIMNYIGGSLIVIGLVVLEINLKNLTVDYLKKIKASQGADLTK